MGPIIGLKKIELISGSTLQVKSSLILNRKIGAVASVATDAVHMGEGRELRSTHPVDLLPPYARDVGSESWRCHCRSRRLAVPMTGPVPHVGNFRNTLALLSIQWPFGLPIPVKHTSFRFSPVELYKHTHDCLYTARVVCTLNGCCKVLVTG